MMAYLLKYKSGDDIQMEMTSNLISPKGTVPHIGKHAYLFSCRELDEEFDATLMSVS